MAKKYLLYIHDSRFDKEPKKSELVNRLLKVHYMDLKDLVNGKAYARGYKADMESRMIKTKQDAEKAVKPLVKDSPWGGPLFRDKKRGRL